MMIAKSGFRLLFAVGAAAVALACILLALAAHPIQAATINVPAGSSLQAAIVAAQPGDTIQVQSGVFTESLEITKSLTLLGGFNAGFTTRAPRTTVISPSSGSGIYIHGSGLQVRVDGLEIKKAADRGVRVVVSDDSRIVIHNNYIHHNASLSNGGGIAASMQNRCALYITDNDVLTNTAASTGGGIYATLVSSNTFTLTGTNIVSNSANMAGGLSVQMSNFSRFRVEDNQVMSNTAGSGNYGGFYFAVGMNADGAFDRNDVIGNRAGGSYGGGMLQLAFNATGTFHDNEFRRNQAGAMGGLGLQVAYDASLAGDNLVVDGNRATTGSAGGLVAGLQEAALNLGNLRVVNNRAQGGHGGGSWQVTSGRLDIRAAYVENNLAAAGDAGGAYVAAMQGSLVTATHLTVVSNTAQGGGGGLYVLAQLGTKVDLAASRLERNRAVGGNGGGVYAPGVDMNSWLDLSSSQFLSNTSGASGGGACVGMLNNNSPLLLNNTTFFSNTAQSGGGVFIGSAGGGSRVEIDPSRFERSVARGGPGGAIYIGSMQDGELTIHGDEFISSTANGPGGALFIGSLNDSQMTVDGSQVISNVARGGPGGAIYIGNIQDGELAVNDSQIISSTATGPGGALFVGGMQDSQMTIEDSLIISNVVHGGPGGALYVGTMNSSQATIDGNRIVSSTATGPGGAIYVGGLQNGSQAAINRNQVISNVAGGGSGGGLYIGTLANSQAAINHNHIVSSTATGPGGAVYVGSLQFSPMTINGNQVISSTATGGPGGGLYLGALALSHLEVMSNTVSRSQAKAGDGGGIYLVGVSNSSNAEFIGNRVDDNVASGMGGGFSLAGPVGSASVLTLRGNQFRRNTARGTMGGGCSIMGANSASRVVFEGNLVNDNIAYGQSGGCDVGSLGSFTGGALLVRGNQFNANKAGQNYGGLALRNIMNGVQVQVADNQIVGNQAGITATAPTATGGRVGGVCLELINNTSATFTGNEIRSNVAYTGSNPQTGQAGGMYALLNPMTLLTMRDNTLSDNAAHDSFGGLHVSLPTAARLDMEHNVIQANTAVTAGGGVYIYGGPGSQYLMRRNRIVGNAAGSQGGVWIQNVAPPPMGLWGVSENNLVAANLGSGIYLQDADWHSINDTLADNGAYGLMMTGTLTSTAWLSNTIVWGHTWSFTRTQAPAYTQRFTMTADYSDIQGHWPGAGNLNANPQFVGGGNYHLQPGSPAVDKVAPARAPAVDLDGVPRPVPVGGQADMGCYEWFKAGVQFEPDRAATGLPGAIVTYQHTLTNTGNMPDTFDLDVPINPLGWPVTVTPSSLALNPNGKAAVQVQVQVPAGTAGDTLNAVTARATSRLDGAVLDIVQDSTMAARVAGVTLTPDRTGKAAPGAVARYEHTLTNTGNLSDTIQLAARSAHGWGVVVRPTVANVPRNGSTTVTVSVTVPLGALAGITDTTMVTATSSAVYGVTKDTVADTSTVDRVAGVSIAPDRSGTAALNATVVYTHTVTNLGNAPDTFSLAATSSLGWVVTVSPASLTLGVGASAVVQVRVTVPAGAGGRTDVSTITATSSYSAASASVTDTTRACSALYLPLVTRNGG